MDPPAAGKEKFACKIKILRILEQWIAMAVNAKTVMSVLRQIARYAIEQSLQTKVIRICIV